MTRRHRMSSGLEKLRAEKLAEWASVGTYFGVLIVLSFYISQDAFGTLLKNIVK